MRHLHHRAHARFDDTDDGDGQLGLERLERGGRRFTIRPEKVRILDGDGSRNGLYTEPGTVRDVAYAGMVTRYLVDLEGGGELHVVKQNLEETSAQALEQRGRRVTVGWSEGQTYTIGQEGT